MVDNFTDLPAPNSASLQPFCELFMVVLSQRGTTDNYIRFTERHNPQQIYLLSIKYLPSWKVAVKSVQLAPFWKVAA